MKPLTAEQSQIAELNHDLVFEFLNEYNLPESQYYDVVIFGYLCCGAGVLRETRIAEIFIFNFSMAQNVV